MASSINTTANAVNQREKRWVFAAPDRRGTAATAPCAVSWLWSWPLALQRWGTGRAVEGREFV